MEVHTLTAPPSDVELGHERQPIDYVLVEPEAGINDDTGLIFWVCGWGMSPTDKYCVSKLMPYLANQANCVVVSVVYHGLKLKLAEVSLRFPVNWTQLMNQRFGTPVDAEPMDIINALPAHGVTEIPMEPAFGIVQAEEHEYLSWGFLPALDHIAVLGDVLSKYRVDKKRLIAMGTSYGGYIVNLMIKFMPNTFSCAIDNSGFTHVLPEMIASYEFQAPILAITPSGLRVPMMRLSAYTFRDPGAPNYFKESWKRIRDLSAPDHVRDSETKLYVFHSLEDTVASYEAKAAFCQLRAAYAPTELKTVAAADVDGALFKDLSHGMRASMRRMFDYVAAREGNMSRSETDTDFDTGSSILFDCGDEIFVFDYLKEGKVTVSLKKVP